MTPNRLALPVLCALIALPAAALWPRCEVVAGKPGGPAILIDGQVNAPLFFCGNNQFGRDDILLQQQRMAAAAGVDLFVFGLSLAQDDETIDATVATFAEATPQGRFYIRIWCGPPRDWAEARPDDLVRRHDGTTNGYASPYSAAYRAWAAGRLRDVVRRIANGPYGGRFIGVGLSYLQTAEWFFPDTDAYWDYSPAAEQAWRDWLRTTYGREKRLQTAWDRPDATFATASIPSPAEREAAHWGPFRHPVRQRPAMDYTRFLGEAMADTIVALAEAVKAETRGRSLVGAFYGYTFELNHNGPRALAHSGHLALGRLLESPAIDIIQAPYSYYQRAPGQPGTYHLPIDSVALHGKLLLLEEDTYTHLASPPAEGLIAPGYEDRPANLEETLAVARRNFGAAFGHGAGMWFFDLLADGRWNDRTFWNGAALLRRIAAEGRSETFAPEVAFIVSEESVAAMRDTTHPELLAALGEWRDAVAMLGAPVGYYLQSDLPKLPDTIKLAILANPYIVSNGEAKALAALARRGVTVVYTRAPGIVGPNDLDVAGIQALAGIAVEARFDRGPSEIRLAGSDEALPLGAVDWQPRFVPALPEGADLLAAYADTGEPAALRIPSGEGRIVYTAVPRLPAELLRLLAEDAGVALYAPAGAAVHRIGPYLIVHSPAAERAILAWPTPFARVDRIAPGQAATVSLPGAKWEDIIPPKATHIYKITP